MDNIKLIYLMVKKIYIFIKATSFTSSHFISFIPKENIVLRVCNLEKYWTTGLSSGMIDEKFFCSSWQTKAIELNKYSITKVTINSDSYSL